MSYGYDLPDHPDIDHIMRYGCPPGETYDDDIDVCEHCGISLDGKDVYSDRLHDALCDECLLELHLERRA